MPNTQTTSERGDVVAMILIVIVIALIGALGFVWYQNATKDTTAPTQAQNNTTTPEKKEKTLALSRWNVEIPLTDDTTSLTAKEADSDTRQVYEIRVAESALFNDKAKTGTQAVGYIERIEVGNDAAEFDSRVTAGKTMSQAIRDGDILGTIVGKYAYTYNSRQQVAYAPGGTDEETRAEKALEALSTETLPAQLKQLRTIK